MGDKKKILLRTTGGTIASVPGGEGLEPHRSDVMERELNQLHTYFDITVQDVMCLDSSNIRPEEWQTIARHIFAQRGGYDGVVVSHGTDTMAYTASAVTFMLPNIDIPVVFTGSQKALAVPPGISMMVLSSRAVERIYANRPACYYLDLKAALKNGERGQTPFTPAVGILIQINARLNQIKRDGFANVQAQIRAIAKDFRSRIGKYPFHIVSDSLSYAVTPLSPNNPEVSAHQLFLTLKDEYGIIICPNGGELADKVFRVGHIGHLTVEDNDALFRAFDDLMARGILKA